MDSTSKSSLHHGHVHTITIQGDFWKEYLDFIKKSGISEKHAKWYLHWVKEFAAFMKEAPLHKCAAQDVKVFLDHLSCNGKKESWQVEQAQTASVISLIP